MSNIEDLHARITAALERLARGVDNLDVGSVTDVVALEAQLEEEKTVTAQLEERLRALKEKQAAELDAVRSHAQDTSAKVDGLDLELQRLRKANVALREANAALRQANEAGVADPDLINRSILAELEALRAARATDVAEASAILSALTPILNAGDPQHQTETSENA